MLTATDLIAIKCGDYNWLCCIPKDKLPNLYELVTGHSYSDIETIMDYCACQIAQQTPTVTTPVAPGATQDLNTAIQSMSLPDSCQSMKDFVCSSTVQYLINALCKIIASLHAAQTAASSDKVSKGILALLDFLCQLYTIACQDDRAAAGFVLGFCVISDAMARSVITLGGLTAVSPSLNFFLNDLLTRMESASAQLGCCPNMLTNNTAVVQQMQAILQG